MSRKWTFYLVGLVLALFVVVNTVFIVPQTHQALVLRFGKPIKVVREPGMNAKIPFVENVEMYDLRLLTFNAEAKEVIAADQKRLIVDAFVRYRITDPLKFKQTVGNEFTMASRLNTILESALRQSLGNVPLSAVISTERAKIMKQVRDIVNKQVTGKAAAEGKTLSGAAPREGFGINVIDVRIVRADLPQANSQSIYQRMQTEREREAKEFRAKGAEDAQKIRALADKDRTVLLAEAQRRADIARGEGDRESVRIFAGAVSQAPEFYEFYRSLEAYRNTLSKDDTTVVLSPGSEFLRYMDKGSGR